MADDVPELDTSKKPLYKTSFDTVSTEFRNSAPRLNAEVTESAVINSQPDMKTKSIQPEDSAQNLDEIAESKTRDSESLSDSDTSVKKDTV